MTPEELRALSATGKMDRTTAGFCPGYVQANLAAVPLLYAKDFEAFCRSNARPCPILEIIGPETTLSKTLAPGANICNTIPRYRIWRNGELVEEVQSVSSITTPDMVFFLLGCSFSFEEALIEAGIPLRHVEQRRNVAMYRTNIPLTTVGIFAGEMVVSMRPIQRDKVELASKTTALYPDVHGAPVHAGDPATIGIKDLQQPDYGEPIEIKTDEIPVFWACGVTPQNVLLNARLPFAITHSPGFMFVSNLKNKDYAKP